jgi:glycine cleavage system transcriptional repressor
MGKRFIVSAFGKDRIGIVADLSEMLYEHGCNLEDTRMTILADVFSSLLLVSGPEKADFEEQISNACRRLEKEKGISAYIRPVGSELTLPKEPLPTHTLKVEGLDQTGIVFKVSKFLADNKVNIVDLKSSIDTAPESGTAIYSMDLQVEVPKDVSMGVLGQGLDQIAADLHVDITIEKS